MGDVTLYCGDCLDILPTLPSESVDCVITDPPYPHIKRDYGTWTTEEWWALIVEGMVPEVRRILKPTGSAVFILQPNSEHVGQMRGWLWEFMAWVCREWNMVQDVYWWNPVVMPNVHTTRGGLMRNSVKICTWVGSSDCFRRQNSVLWTEAESSKARYAQARISGEEENGLTYHPSGHHKRWKTIRMAAERRGGVTPFNMLPFANTNSSSSAGANGHGAGTPLKLADWWTRYICPPDGTVLDPFVGSGTMVLAALQNGCSGIGIDKEQRYIDIAQKRVDEAMSKMVQAEMTI